MATLNHYTGEMLELTQVGLGMEPAILIEFDEDDGSPEFDENDLPLIINISLLSLDQATILLEGVVDSLKAAGYGQYSGFDYVAEED